MLKKHKKHKKQIVLLALAFLFLLGAAVYAGIKIGQWKSPTGKENAYQTAHENKMPVDSDPNAVSIDQEYIDSLNKRMDALDEQSQANAQTMRYHLFTDVAFTSKMTEQELPIWNDPLNPLPFQVAIRLDEDSLSTQAALVQTGAIAPGQMLRRANLSRPLEKGTYEAVFVYTPIDGKGTEYSSFEAHTVIHVQ